MGKSRINSTFSHFDCSHAERGNNLQLASGAKARSLHQN